MWDRPALRIGLRSLIAMFEGQTNGARSLMTGCSHGRRQVYLGSARCASFRTGKGDITMKHSRLASLVAILLCALAVSACANTMRGAAKDVTTTVDAAAE